jgi:hypothetical protein
LKKVKKGQKKAKTRLQVSQHFSNRPQQKLAPIFVNNPHTMYAAGFRKMFATLLRLPKSATNHVNNFSRFAP